MKICVPESFGASRDLSEIDEELFEVNSSSTTTTTSSPTGSVLSANAIPYHPPSSSYYYYHEPVEIAIYNDGVPCMTIPTEADRNMILHGISDEAIFDEGCFPLDAEDAAELDATEEFVFEMANLALLEEREEEARRSFNHIKKRWEARRKAGLLNGRPNPAMNLIVANEHPIAKNSTPLTTTLVPFTNGLRMHQADDKMRVKEILHAHKMMEPRNAKKGKGTNMANNKTRRPIQQPRKDS